MGPFNRVDKSIIFISSAKQANSMKTLCILVNKKRLNKTKKNCPTNAISYCIIPKILKFYELITRVLLLRI